MGTGEQGIGPGWGSDGLRYDKEYLADYVQRVHEAGGIMTFDIALYRDGHFDQMQLETLKYVGNKINWCRKDMGVDDLVTYPHLFHTICTILWRLSTNIGLLASTLHATMYSHQNTDLFLNYNLIFKAILPKNSLMNKRIERGEGLMIVQIAWIITH